MPLTLNCLSCLQMLPFHVSSKVLCVVLGFVYSVAFSFVKYDSRFSGMYGLYRASYTQQAIPPEAVNSLLMWNKLSSTKWQITAVQCYSSARDSSSWGILLHSSNRSCGCVSQLNELSQVIWPSSDSWLLLSLRPHCHWNIFLYLEHWLYMGKTQDHMKVLEWTSISK